MNKYERASQIWPVLAWAARHRQTITYPQLGQLIGVPRQGLGQLLEPIQAHCMARGLPPLTSLVVQQGTGLPGTGFIGSTAKDLASAQSAVFRKDWLKEGNPGPEGFEHS